MPNTLNKDRNKNPEDDSIHVAREILNRTQQSDRRHRLQQLTEGYGSGVTGGDHGTTGALTNGVQSPSRSRERLIEEARERQRVIKETKEELANWCTPRGNPDRKEASSTAQSVEGTQARGELFVRDTPNEQIQFGRNNEVLKEAFTPLENVGVRNMGVQSGTGVQNNVGIDSSA